jgi:hypothetical protein
MKFVMFEGDKLMYGSDAYELFHDKDDRGHVKLRAHMKEIDRQWRKQENR